MTLACTALAAQLPLLGPKTLILDGFFCAHARSKKPIPDLAESSKITAFEWRKMGHDGRSACIENLYAAIKNPACAGFLKNQFSKKGD